MGVVAPNKKKKETKHIIGNPLRGGGVCCRHEQTVPKASLTKQLVRCSVLKGFNLLGH